MYTIGIEAEVPLIARVSSEGLVFCNAPAGCIVKVVDSTGKSRVIEDFPEPVKDHYVNYILQDGESFEIEGFMSR